MSGIQKFFNEAKDQTITGAMITSGALTFVFAILVTSLDFLFDSGFIVTLCVIFTIASIVSLVFFFVTFAMLIDDLKDI